MCYQMVRVCVCSVALSYLTLSDPVDEARILE